MMVGFWPPEGTWASAEKVSLPRGAIPGPVLHRCLVDRGQAEQQHVSGVRVDGGVVVIMTEERDW